MYKVLGTPRLHSRAGESLGVKSSYYSYREPEFCSRTHIRELSKACNQLQRTQHPVLDSVGTFIGTYQDRDTHVVHEVLKVNENKS